MMELVLKPGGAAPIYNCMLFVKNYKSGFQFIKATGFNGVTSETISTAHQFRIGSISKLFTTTIILQLAEEGLLNLEHFYLDLVDTDTRKMLSGLHCKDGVEYSFQITLRHLLSHSSGLRDYFSEDERFINFVTEHPLHSWNWKTVIEKYFEFGLHALPAFTPGEGYHYADTNYLLLAVLIEQITGKPLHEVYRDKIISPLNLTDTFLEFYENPEQSKSIVHPFYGTHSLANTNTSFDWGGGGLVSTMQNINLFIRNMVNGKLFRKAGSLEQLLSSQFIHDGKSFQHGLGIQTRAFRRFTFFGHNSAYGSLAFYEPQKDISIILSLNQARSLHKAEWVLKKIISEIPI